MAKLLKYLSVRLIEAEQTCQDGIEGYNATYNTVDKYLAEYTEFVPKDIFEHYSRPTTGLNFGLAIEAMKKGFKVARSGWNGKGMFVVYQKGYPDGIPCNKQTAEAWGLNEGDLFICRPYLQLKCADGSHAMWSASTSDALADDWSIVE